MRKWFCANLRKIDQPAGNERGLIINLPRIPSIPNLISQLLINQQGFYVNVGEHGQRMGGFGLISGAINVQLSPGVDTCTLDLSVGR